MGPGVERVGDDVCLEALNHLLTYRVLRSALAETINDRTLSRQLLNLDLREWPSLLLCGVQLDLACFADGEAKIILQAAPSDSEIPLTWLSLLSPHAAKANPGAPRGAGLLSQSLACSAIAASAWDLAGCEAILLSSARFPSAIAR
jgi:hypothetical protein